MQQKEAIILAGGLGTRLRSAVPNLPKCMAPVNAKPFVHYVIQYLQKQGVQHFIFSLGYLHEIIEHYLQENFSEINYTIVIEDEPLGTGGAIYKAMQMATANNVIITNGDTLFEADINAQLAVHNNNNAMCTLALKPMHAFDRYGVVALNEQQQVVSFQEKKFYQEGLINGGLYILQTKAFLNLPFPEKFSFEKDFLESFIHLNTFYGSINNGYFIDIGIPSDYEKAQTDFAHKF